MNINFTLNVSTEDLTIFKEFGKYLIDSNTADRKERTKRQFIEKIAGVVIGQIKNAAENEPEQENHEQPQDVNDQVQQSQPNINEAEQQWAEIRAKNIDRDIAVWHMPPQLEEVADALGYTVSDLPDVIARLVDGEYGEVSVEDLQMIEKKIGEKIYFRQAGNDDVDVADLDPSDYPLTEDDDEEKEEVDEPARELTDDEKYENIEWNAPVVVLFDGMDVTKDALVDKFNLGSEDDLPTDLVFEAGDIISFGSFKHLANKLPNTTILVRLPKGIFEVKNLNLRKVDDEWETLVAWCKQRVSGVNGVRPYAILLPSKNPTMEEFVECIGALVVDNKFKLPENIEKDSDGRIKFAWLKRLARAVNAPGKIKVLEDDEYVDIEDVYE